MVESPRQCKGTHQRVRYWLSEPEVFPPSNPILLQTCRRLRNLSSKALESQECMDTTNAFREAWLLFIPVFFLFFL